MFCLVWAWVGLILFGLVVLGCFVFKMGLRLWLLFGFGGCLSSLLFGYCGRLVLFCWLLLFLIV